MDINPRGHVCLSFDFDGPSLWIMRQMTTAAPVSRGEFGAVAVPRILKLLATRSMPATFFIPGHTIETYIECGWAMSYPTMRWRHGAAKPI